MWAVDISGMEICPADADTKEVVRKVALHCDLEYVQVSLRRDLFHMPSSLSARVLG